MFSAAWVSVEGCLSDEIETSTVRVTLDCLIAALQSLVLGLRLRLCLMALAVRWEAVFLLDAGGLCSNLAAGSEEQFTSGDSTVSSSSSIKSGCCGGKDGKAPSTESLMFLSHVTVVLFKYLTHY